MKLALLGYPIKHSLSPKLYQEILGPKLTSYDLLACEKAEDVPSLTELGEKYVGINITTPYKEHFIKDIIIESPLVRSLNAVNALSFTPQGVLGTNTDMLAVEEILNNYRSKYKNLHLILLGDGVMARVTELVAQNLNLSLEKLSRKVHGNISDLDLKSFRHTDSQNIIINSCSREFVFNGLVSNQDIFWDYNYAFEPHQKTLPFKVLSYEDGREMLKLQAQAAVKFWYKTNPKLKC